MERIPYNNQKVYTQSSIDITKKDLSKTNSEEVEVKNAYFFKIDGDRQVEEVPFNFSAIKRNKSGLMIDIPGASISIAGLERICSLLCDTGANIRNLNPLKGKKVTKYWDGILVYGIGIKI